MSGTTKINVMNYGKRMMDLMDRKAEELYGEFGFSTCTPSEQQDILDEIGYNYIVSGKLDLRSSR